MMIPNNSFLNSPLSGLLSQPPRTVEPPQPPPIEPPEPAPVAETPPQTSMLSGFWGGQSQAAEPERLTADEIKARAEVQTRTYGAFILLINAFIECFKVSMTFEKGEYQAYLDLKSEFKDSLKQDVVILYESDPNVKELWIKGEKFEETLQAIEADTELEDWESKILFKAIKGDLERKNKKNEINDISIWGAVFQLSLARQISSLLPGITKATRRLAKR